MRLLFFFIDGIGLGENNPASNPFAKAKMPIITSLLGGRHLVKNSAPYHNIRASLLAIDACLGVNGVPQSATGQAALLTGKNIPQAVGYHFGPWPNQIVVDRLEQGNLFPVLFLRNNSQHFIYKRTRKQNVLFFIVEQVILEEWDKQQDNQDDSLCANHPIRGSEY